MDLLLPSERERQISEKVAAGRYTSASEMVQEGLELRLAVEDGGLKRGPSLDQDMQLWAGDARFRPSAPACAGVSGIAPQTR